MNKTKTAWIAAAIAILTLSGSAYAQESERGDGERRGGAFADRGEEPRRFDRGETRRSHARTESGFGQDARPGRFDNRVDRRQTIQRDRIREGRHSGELTRSEMDRLRRDQKRISRMEHRFERDGYYSRGERRKLDRALDRSSQRIKRYKHNDRTPGYARDRSRWGKGHSGHARRYGPPSRHWRHGHHRSSCDVCEDAGEEEVVYVATGSSSRAVDLDLGNVRVTWNESKQF